MNNFTRQRTLEIYIKLWSEVDNAKRLKLFQQCLSLDCVYTDPNVQVDGYEQLSAYRDEFRKAVPGGGFSAVDVVSHHDSSLMHWHMLDGAGTAISKGASYFRFGTDGRLVQMAGFFEPAA